MRDILQLYIAFKKQYQPVINYTPGISRIPIPQEIKKIVSFDSNIQISLPEQYAIFTIQLPGWLDSFEYNQEYYWEIFDQHTLFNYLSQKLTQCQANK